MSRKRQLHVSDVLKLIHHHVGIKFSYNDVKHLITKSQMSALNKSSLINKTGSVVVSTSITKSTSMIPVWTINDSGIRCMKQFANDITTIHKLIHYETPNDDAQCPMH